MDERIGGGQGWARWREPLLLAMLWGAALLFRLADLGARNLWTDEAWVALAVLKDTPAAVLAAGQSTPPLYLLGVWAVVQVFGASEAVLRSLSLAMGLAVVALFWPLARRLAPPGAAWLGLAWVAVSPVLVYFSKELKQYSGDAMFAVLMALLAERLKERPTAGRLAWLAGAGVVGLGFSHPLVFVLPVVAGTAALSLPRVWRAWLGGVGLLWGLAFLAYHELYFRPQLHPQLIAYWAQDFPDLTGVIPFLVWLGGALGRYFHYFFGDWAAWWAAMLLLLGLGCLVRQGRVSLLGYLVGPLLLALAAAALHRYPFMGHYNGSRLMLFSAPFLYLGVAMGVASLLAWLGKRQRLLAGGVALALLLSLNPLKLVQENLHPSVNRSQVQPLLKILAREADPRDYVYVYYYATNSFKYYLPDYQGRVRWGRSCVEAGLIIDDEDDDDGDDQFPARVWLVAAHFPDLAYMENFAGNLLGPGWRRTAAFTQPGAVLYRFERQGPTSVAKVRERPGRLVSGSPAPPSGKASAEPPRLPAP